MTRLRSALVALFFCLAGHAQAADYPCMPDTPLMRMTGAGEIIGSKPIELSTPAGEITGWWCMDPITATTPPGKVTFSRWYQWSLNRYRGHPDLRAAFKRVMAAQDLLAAVNGEMRAGSIPVAPGSQDEYEVKVLIRNACIALTTPPYLVPIDEPPAGVCGAAPVPPGPVAETWRTPGTGTFTLYTVAAGKLAAIVAGKKAAANAVCNCTTKVASGSSTYCPIAAAPPTEFTLCRKVTP